jgi:hypothetical protein
MVHIMKHFIFGYGSLICPRSRSVTAPTLQTAIAEPAMIKHIERMWSARILKGDSLVSNKNREHIRGWTPMGIRRRENASCNGVLIHVDDEELARFDIREEGYKRNKIALIDVYRHYDYIDNSSAAADVLVLDGVRCQECRIVFEIAHKKRSDRRAGLIDDSDIAVWVYIQNEDCAPNPSFPITQSYVDVIMRGCLAVSKEFARMFLQTTHGWWQEGEADRASNANNDDESDKSASQHHTWVDDRKCPMYIRADSDFSLENADTIDRMIEEHHPHAFKRRVVCI